MKKIFVLIFSVVLVLFLIIAFFKIRTSKVSDESHSVKISVEERNKIQQFWEFYRQATKARIAGRAQEAITAYRRAYELNDEHENTLYFLGGLVFEAGRYQEAEQLWKRLLQINPKSTRAHLQLGSLYLYSKDRAFNDVDSAKAEFQKAVRLNKEETGPLLSLGQIALIQGKLSEAGSYFESVIGSNYRSVEAYFLKGFIAWKQKDFQKALDSFSMAVKYARPDKPVKGVLGEGDTKPGETFQKSNLQTFFQIHLQNLAGMDESELLHHMEVRYQELDVFLAEKYNTE